MKRVYIVDNLRKVDGEGKVVFIDLVKANREYEKETNLRRAHYKAVTGGKLHYDDYDRIVYLCGEVLDQIKRQKAGKIRKTDDEQYYADLTGCEVIIDLEDKALSEELELECIAADKIIVR